jgi:hypothetical protein
VVEQDEKGRARGLPPRRLQSVYDRRMGGHKVHLQKCLATKDLSCLTSCLQCLRLPGSERDSIRALKELSNHPLERFLGIKAGLRYYQPSTLSFAVLSSCPNSTVILQFLLVWRCTLCPPTFLITRFGLVHCADQRSAKSFWEVHLVPSHRDLLSIFLFLDTSLLEVHLVPSPFIYSPSP